jgi:hypothetical protein
MDDVDLYTPPFPDPAPTRINIDENDSDMRPDRVNCGSERRATCKWKGWAGSGERGVPAGAG